MMYKSLDSEPRCFRQPSMARCAVAARAAKSQHIVCTKAKFQRSSATQQRQVLKETPRICYTFGFAFIFGHCTFRNLLLMPKFSRSHHLDLQRKELCCVTASSSDESPLDSAPSYLHIRENPRMESAGKTPFCVLSYRPHQQGFTPTLHLMSFSLGASENILEDFERLYLGLCRKKAEVY